MDDDLASLVNDPLLERIKSMVHDSMTDERVKKKLMSVLASWHRQFKDEPRMAVIAGLYQAAGGGQKKVFIRNMQSLSRGILLLDFLACSEACCR